MIVVYLYKYIQYIQIKNLRVLVSVVLPFFWSECIIMSNSVLNLYCIFLRDRGDFCGFSLSIIYTCYFPIVKHLTKYNAANIC